MNLNLAPILVAALVLGTGTLALVPTAAADTCAFSIEELEKPVCAPVLLAYCTLYAVVEKHPLVNCVRSFDPLP